MERADNLYKLDRLAMDGEELLSPDEGAHLKSGSVSVWLAGVSDILKRVLPKDSSLLKSLPKLENDEFPMSEDNTKKEMQATVEKTLQIIQYAKLSLTEPIENSLERHKQELEAKRKEIEREINNNILDGYFKSWAFRIPIGILVIAIIFAITGAIQIQQYSLNVQDITDRAIERARQDILTQTELINSNLNALTESEQNRIKESVTAHIENLVDERAPEADSMLTEFSGRASAIELSIGSLEERSEPLVRAAETINASPPTLIDAAGLFMTRTGWLIWGILVLSVLALIFSLIAIFRSRKGFNT